MYRLIRFGTTTLEYANPIDSIGSGATPASYFGLPEGGALDGYGAGTKNPGLVERMKQMRLVAGTPATLEAAFFGLLALRGKRDRLYRRTTLGDIHWMYARLVEVVTERSYEQARYRRIQDVELRFACQEAGWRGAWRGAWTLDSGIYLDSGYDFEVLEEHVMTGSPASFTITVGSASDAGRAPVRAIIIHVVNGVSGEEPPTAITALAISNAATGDVLTFSGTLSGGKALVINTGTMQVLNDGADAYASLTLAPGADMAAWFTLLPGANAITVTYTGGISGAHPEIWFEFFEEWF